MSMVEKESLLQLVEQQMQALRDRTYIGDEHKVYQKIWKRLEPILSRLSDAMAERSPFKEDSIWVFNPSWYDRIIVERMHNRTHDFEFKIGMSNGMWICASLTFPINVEDMEFEDVLKWALEHDEKIYEPLPNTVGVGFVRSPFAL